MAADLQMSTSPSGNHETNTNPTAVEMDNLKRVNADTTSSVNASLSPSSTPLASPPAASAPVATTPNITLDLRLLPPNGNQHPYPIDVTYLRSRDMTVENDDPYNLSIPQLKQLIIKDWRSDWKEGPPAQQSLMRLIYMGKVLGDEQYISETRMSKDSPNVVHISLANPPVDDEGDPDNSKVASNRGSQSANRGACCCVIQ